MENLQDIWAEWIHYQNGCDEGEALVPKAIFFVLWFFTLKLRSFSDVAVIVFKQIVTSCSIRLEKLWSFTASSKIVFYLINHIRMFKVSRVRLKTKILITDPIKIIIVYGHKLINNLPDISNKQPHQNMQESKECHTSWIPDLWHKHVNEQKDCWYNIWVHYQFLAQAAIFELEIMVNLYRPFLIL